MIKVIYTYLFIANLLLSFAFISCADTNSKLEEALGNAGNNRAELEYVLNYFSNDSEKKRMAEYLIANMPAHYGFYDSILDSIEDVLRPMMHYDGMITLSENDYKKWKDFKYQSLPQKWDCNVVSSKYLIDNIEHAYKQYKNRKWNKNLPFDDFCEYILPYRIGDEPLTPWREAYEKRFLHKLDSLYQGDDVLVASRIVRDLVDADLPNRYNSEISMPHRSALALLNNHVGQCRDDCDRYIYALRACGIPATSDHILISPEYGSGHDWVSVRDNKSKHFIPITGDINAITRDSIVWDRRVKGKVYRYKYTINDAMSKRVEMLVQQGCNMPNEVFALCDYTLYDVSDNYFGSNKVSVPIGVKINETVFLGVHPKGTFLPIDFGEPSNDGSVIFRNVEPNVLYTPIVKHTEWEPAGNAFVVHRNGETTFFEPDKSNINNLHLITKMPHNWRQKEWLEDFMIGITLEGTNDVAGEHTDTIAQITSSTGNNYFRLKIKKQYNTKNYQYLKINPPTGKYNYLLLGEVEIYSDSNLSHKIPYDVIDDLPERCNIANISDEDILSYAETPKDYGAITLKTSHPTNICECILVPRNTDNFVWPGQEYELLYLCGHNGWKSVGRKIAQHHWIDFNAPTNAVYLLRNLTKGIEEQYFIYEDGMQKFNIDLH